MLWYENIKPDIVENDIQSLIRKNPNLNTEEAIIFFINNDNGFGSNLTLIVQNSLFMKNINSKLHCLGHFSVNGCNFKYHEPSYNNSFFLYFNYLKNIPENTKYYFVKLDYLGFFPFIMSQSINNSNVDDIEVNRVYSSYFKRNFKVKIGEEIMNNINNIKKETNIPLIGLHIRSLAQILLQQSNETIENRILKIKNEFDKKYINYNIFLITDVSEYIEIVKTIFKEKNINIYYNNFINRIQNHGDGSSGLLRGYNDSVINIDNKYTGFKLGSDIIFDCLSLIHCDYYYVSITNIAFITSFINNNNNGRHYQ